MSRHGSWTPEEDAILIKCMKEKMENPSEISRNYLPHRDHDAIRKRIIYLRKTSKEFGYFHKDDKYSFSREVIEEIRPKVVFEGYAGIGYQTKQYIGNCEVIFCVDSDPKVEERRIEYLQPDKVLEFDEYKILRFSDTVVYSITGDVVDGAAFVKGFGFDVDYVDLDPYSSAVIEAAHVVRLLRPKYLMMTFGEWQSIKLHNMDFLFRVLFSGYNAFEIRDMHIDDIINLVEYCLQMRLLTLSSETKKCVYMEKIKEQWLGETKHRGIKRVLFKEKSIDSYLKVYRRLFEEIMSYRQVDVNPNECVENIEEIISIINSRN